MNTIPTVLNIDVDMIDVPKHRMRKVYSGTDIIAVQNLARDILVNGLQSPIGVKPSLTNGRWQGRYTLIYGLRRLKAHQYGSMPLIMARVYEVDYEAAQLIEITENLMRKDLSRMEESYHRVEYIKLMKKAGHSIPMILAKAGISRVTIGKDFKRVSAAARVQAERDGTEPISITPKSTPAAIDAAQALAAPIVAEAADLHQNGVSERSLAPMEALEPDTILVRVNTVDPKKLARWFAEHIGNGEKEFTPAFLRLLSYELSNIVVEFERKNRRAVVTNPV